KAPEMIESPPNRQRARSPTVESYDSLKILVALVLSIGCLIQTLQQWVFIKRLTKLGAGGQRFKTASVFFQPDTRTIYTGPSIFNQLSKERDGPSIMSKM